MKKSFQKRKITLNLLSFLAQAEAMERAWRIRKLESALKGLRLERCVEM